MEHDLSASIARCIRRVSPLGQSADFDEDTHLIRAGVIDSLAVLHLVTELEQLTGRDIADDLIRVEAFTSVRTLARFVRTLPPPT